MNVPVQVRRHVTAICQRCAAPIRLHASITAGECCCCRKRCHLEHGFGCQVCGVLLPDCDAELGLCVGCRVIA